MVISHVDSAELFKAEFHKLYTDASYSAQTYYEASKAAEAWGRAIVFVPALFATASSLLVILGQSKLWGVVGVVSAAVIATASFLGTAQKASAFRAAGNCFTKIRQEARMWGDSFVEIRPTIESFETLNRLRSEYAAVIDKIELPSNYFFRKANRRISEGVLDYSQAEDSALKT